MRLRTQFILLLSSTVVASLAFLAMVLSRSAESDAEGYVTDIQSNLILSAEKQLLTRMHVLHGDVAGVVRLKHFSLEASFSKLPGVIGGEWWRGKTLIAQFPKGRAVELPVDGTSDWTLSAPRNSESVGSIRWTGRFGELVVILDLSPDWFGELLNVSHGTTSELVDSTGAILMRTGVDNKTHGREQFHSLSTLKRYTQGSKSHLASSMYETPDGQPFFGTFLRLTTDPGLYLVVRSPASSIKKVTGRVYQRALIVGGITLGLAFLFGSLFSLNLTRPLEVLALAAKDIGKGNLERSLPLERNDEIGHLARVLTQMQQDLAKTREDLVKSERIAAFGKLSASIAHEIKSPLGILLTGVQLIVRRLKGAPQQLDLDEILKRSLTLEQEILRMNKKMIQLMKYARQNPTPAEVISLSDRLRMSLDIVRPSLVASGIELEAHFPTDTLYCKANGDEIHEVVLNLVENAEHAMRGVSNKRIRVSLETTGVAAILMVEDNGRGIASDVQSRIFEPFFTTKGIGEGTGLGLAVIHGIILNHGGSIKVESQVGEFTRFVISLPVETAYQEAV